MFEIRLGKTKTDSQSAGQAALKALEHLEGRMKTVSAESNAFATRYRFGGIVAVIALLNADLLLDETVLNLSWSPENWPTYLVLGGLLLAVLLLSWLYFDAVNRRILRFNTAYRATKHKYELLLYGLLTDTKPDAIALTLESKLKAATEKIPIPTEPKYEALKAYLSDHHARSQPGSEADVLEARMPLYIIILAVVVKALMYLLRIL